MSKSSTFVGLMAFFAMVPVAVPAAALAATADAKCVIVDASALNPQETRKLEAKGYKVRRTAAVELRWYIKGLADHEFGFQLIRQTTTVVLMKQYKIRGQAAFGSFETRQYFGMKPTDGDISSAFPTCAYLKSQKNRLAHDVHMKFFAKRMMDGISDPRRLPEPQMGENLLAMEALQAYPKFEDAVRVFRASLDRYNKYLAQIERTKNLAPLERLDVVRQILHPMWGSYCGKKPGMLAFLGSDAPCGNCQSSALLFASVFVDAKLTPPPGYDPLIQLFGPNKKNIGHIRMVLRKRGDVGKVYDITAGAVDSNVQGPLYSLNLVYFAALNKIANTDPLLVSKSNYFLSTDFYKRLAVDMAPGIRGFFAQLFQQDIKMPFRRSSGNSYDWGIGFGVFGEGDAPARATQAYAKSDFNTVYPPQSSENPGSGQYQQEASKPGWFASLFGTRSAAGTTVVAKPKIDFPRDSTLTLEYYNQAEINWIRQVKAGKVSELEIYDNIFLRKLYSGKSAAPNEKRQYVEPIRFVLKSYDCYDRNNVKVFEAIDLATSRSKAYKAAVQRPLRSNNYNYVDALESAYPDGDCRDINTDQVSRSTAASSSSAWFGTGDQYSIFFNSTTLEISDGELYRKIKLLPAHKRLAFLMASIANKIDSAVSSQPYQKLLAEMRAVVRDPLVANGPYDKEGSEVLQYKISPLSSTYQALYDSAEELAGPESKLLGDGRFIRLKTEFSSRSIHRRYVQDLLQISKDMSDSLAKRRWDVVRHANRLSEGLGLALYKYKFASGYLGEELGRFDATPDMLAQLSLLLKGQDRFDSQLDITAALNPLRRMMIACLFDKEFQFAPPRDNTERQLLEQVRQKVLRREPAPQLKNGSLPPSPENGKGTYSGPVQVTVISEQDLPASMKAPSRTKSLIMSLDRKKVPVKPVVFLKLITASFNMSDLLNPAIQFAVLPLWTKAVYKEAVTTVSNSAHLTLFSYDPVFFVDGESTVYPDSSIEKFDSLNPAQVVERGRSLYKAPIAKASRMHEFFKTDPVLRNAWAYYSVMPARYFQSSQIPQSPFPYGLQRVPLHVDIVAIYKDKVARLGRSQTNEPTVESQPTSYRGRRRPRRMYDLEMNPNQSVKDFKQVENARVGGPFRNQRVSIVELVENDSKVLIGMASWETPRAQVRVLAYKGRIARPTFQSFHNNMILFRPGARAP